MVAPSQEGYEDWCRQHPEEPVEYRAVWHYLCDLFESPGCYGAVCCCKGMIEGIAGASCSRDEAQRKRCWSRNNDLATCILIFDIVKKYVANGKRFWSEERKDRFEMVVEGL